MAYHGAITVGKFLYSTVVHCMKARDIKYTKYLALFGDFKGRQEQQCRHCGAPIGTVMTLPASTGMLSRDLNSEYILQIFLNDSRCRVPTALLKRDIMVT